MAWTLVTGGAKNLGANICLTLAQHGYDVVIHYHQSRSEALEVVQACQAFGVRAASIQGDFSSTDSILDFVKRYLHQFQDTANLINNVGNYLIKTALETEVEEWDDLFQTNVKAPFILIKNLISSIRLHQGHIVNLGLSGIGSVQANTYCTVYSMAKLSLWMMTRSLAKELASDQVRVNMVSPGYLETSMDLPKRLDRLPMGRLAQCVEVSQVIVFLLSQQGTYITGQNIEVAGGIGL